MGNELFSRSWSDVHASCVRVAVQDVEHLDRSVISNPALAGVLEKIVAKQKIEVATITREGVHADARTINREVNDYGRRVTVPHKVLDVTIPVRGNPETLTIRPSSCVLIDRQCEIRGMAIYITVEDNDRADSEIEGFIKLVNENLDELRKEIARYDGQVAKAVKDAADRRIAEIDEDKKRDQGRKVLVRRA